MTRSGWLTFSAVVLIIAGIMRVFDAIWAFGYHGAISDNLQGALLGHSLATYGWIWLVITAIFVMPYYAVWSLIYIAIAVMVIYGLSAHYDAQTA